MLSIPAYGKSSWIAIKTDGSGYSSHDGSTPRWGVDGSFGIITGKTNYYSGFHKVNLQYNNYANMGEYPLYEKLFLFC
jgi:hypothetical protein